MEPVLIVLPTYNTALSDRHGCRERKGKKNGQGSHDNGKPQKGWLVADVVMLPGDAFVRAIAKVAGKEYGGVRVISDVTMSVTAGISCFLFLHKLSGVREGTILAALITGNIVKLFTKKFNRLTALLLAVKR